MALRASIGADFAQFSQALTNVELKLKDTGDIAKNVGRDLSKMVEGFRGTDIMRQAELAAAGIDKIGGVSRLTETEQRKVNATVTEAIAKYRALGQEVPAHLQKIADQTKGVGTATDTWTTGIGKMATGYLVGMASFATVQRVLGGMVDFLKSSVEEAAKAEAAQKRLDTAMKTAGVATEGNRAAFKALADELQRTTTIEDDQVVALEAFGLQLGIMPSQMDGAIKAAANLSAGLGVDLETALRMIVKANNESFTAFGKLGISIDEARAKAEGLPYVLEQINKGVGGQAAAEVETYAGRIKQLGNEWGNLKEAIGGIVTSNGFLADSLGNLSGILRGVTSLSGNWTTALGLMAASIHGPQGIVAYLSKLGSMPPPKLDPKGVTDGAMAMNEALKNLNASFDKLAAKAAKQFEQDAEKAAAAAEKAAEKVKAWRDSVRDLGFVLDFQQQGLGNLNHITVTSTGLLDRYADTIDNLASSDLPRMYEALGAVGHKIVSVSLDTEKASLTFRERFAASVGKVTDVLDQLSRVAEMSGHRTTAALMSTASATAKAFASGGPWAAAMAFASGLLTTFADKLFKTEGRKVNDLRDAFIAAAGGVAVLNAKAAAAGMTLDALLKAKTVKEYEAAVAALNKELGRTAQLQSELAGLQAQLAARQVMDWQRAQELIERYGGTLGNLGQQFEAAKQAANWKSIWDDWQTLIDMGADVGGVLVSMKDEIGALVQESLRIGTEIPAQFRPLIEELIRTGQLFNANGEAITDISQLKFGAPLVSEVDKIITKIDELIEALTGHLIPAIGRIPRDIEIGVGYTYDDYVGPRGGSGGGGPWNDWPGGGDSASYGGAQASGGDYLVTRPTWFLAGEAGPERATFTPRGSTASSAGSAVNVSITIQALDPIGLKRVVEQEVVPLLVSAYRRNVNGARTDTRKELVD